MSKYQSHAGYFGAISMVMLTIGLIYFEKNGIILEITYMHVYAIIGITFIVMAIAEIMLKRRFNNHNSLKEEYSALSKSNMYILKSSLIRFFALFIPFLLIYYLVENHNFFTSQTRIYFNYLFYIFLFLGIPYIFITQKFKGGHSYEFKDYSVITIIFIKSIFTKDSRYKFYKNRRVKKVLRLYLVNLIFITLMTQFITFEIFGVRDEYIRYLEFKATNISWYRSYQNIYLMIFHTLFSIDVAIALIGYTISSRWLNNRTKSVDSTLSGWMIALACYPPLNSITSKFISYNGLDTYQLITNEYILAIVLTLLIILYTIYVWATVALGFKFSNLTNRGIVNIGPYKYVRHPAYVAKNLAWWVDNTFVLTNIWATIAMALWNLIYALRALTEERHLKQDRDYEEYIKHVKYRFLPKTY